MKIAILSALMALVLGCGPQDDSSEVVGQPFDHKYASYGEMLDRYVEDGLVNYAGLKTDRQVLDTLVDKIASADLSRAASGQKLAFYINTYNILTLRSIVDAYPVGSIKDIDGVWDDKKWRVAGDRLTLNEIEHEILRKEFTEPRIHFAIVCASIGCPPLRSQPYYADSLESQLTSAAKHFATDPRYNVIDPETGTAQLSSIFDWFGDDFIKVYFDPVAFPNHSKKESAVLSFLISQFPEEDREALRSVEYEISYMEYDWSLNDMK